MAVGGEKSFDELLKRLSEVKPQPLPQRTSPFRTRQAASGARLRDTALAATKQAPGLDELIAEIQQGSNEPTGAKGLLYDAIQSPPGQVLFGGLKIIDTPRRSIISAIKETKDALDGDPRTKFKSSEYFKQVSDPTFGWGRVRPGKGWGGRIEGFIGDVLLDPLTYLTFGASVPIKSAGAKALIQAGAGKTLFRRSIAVSGREGRFALAKVARDLGASDDIVKNVAARGKSALPKELAERMGVPQAGLYMFGSRVRVPGTGRLGEYLERGLVTIRTGAMNTGVGRKLSYLYTPRGAAIMGDLSTWRADVASGRLEPSRVKMIMSALNGAEDARTLGASQYRDEIFRITGLLDSNPELQKIAGDVAQYIEKPSSVILSPPQQAAKEVVEAYLREAKDRITVLMREIEPSWAFPDRANYVPHVLTQKAREVIEARISEPWAQRLEQYLSVDVMDVKGNLEARRITEGMPDFLGSGRPLEDGSISGINKAFREVTGENFDLFESDIGMILRGYARTVSAAREVNALMKNLMDDDFVRVMRETGHIDEEFLSALRTYIDNKWDDVAKNTEKAKDLQKRMQELLRQNLGANGTVAKRLLSEEKALLGEVADLTKRLDEATKVADGLVPLLEQFDTVSAAQLAALEELGRLAVGGNAATTFVKEQVRGFQKNVDALRAQVEVARQQVARNKLEEWSSNWIAAVDEELKSVGRQLEANSKMLELLQSFGNSFGPELSRIFKAFYEDAFDDDVVNLGERMVSAATKGFKETDEQFNRVVDTVSNPFTTEYLAGPGGGADGITDEWVRGLGTDPGDLGWSPFEDQPTSIVSRLLDSIPDLGARGSKAERASMGSTRKNARSMTLAEARKSVVRGSVIGDNSEDLADAFYFFTLREIRAVELAAGADASVRVEARRLFAQELLEGNTERARAWRATRAAVEDLQKNKHQFDVLASERAQMGTVKIGGRTISLSDDGRDLVDSLRSELADMETLPRDATMRGLYESLVSDLQRISNLSGAVPVEEVGRLAAGIRQFFDLSTLDVGSVADVASRNLKALDDFLEGIINEDLTINVAKAGDTLRLIQAFAQKHLSTEALEPAAAAMKRAEIEEALNNPLIARADYVSQKAALAEQTVARSAREVGEVLVNYSVYHNARVAVDYVQRLVPDGVEISDALLRFAFAGSARQHAQYVETWKRAARFVSNHWAQIEEEMVNGVMFADRAQWLKQRLLMKRVPTEGGFKLVPMSDFELEQVSQIMGDLSLTARRVPRDIQAWRPSQPQWAAHVKKVLDITDAGWDNSMTSEIAAEVGAEVSGVSVRAQTYVGPSKAIPVKGVKKMGSRVERDMQSAFTMQSEVNNKISNMRKISPEKLIEKLTLLRNTGELAPRVIDDLIEQTKVLDTQLKSEWKAYKVKIKEETGYSVAELNVTRRAMREAPGDTYGMAFLWEQATRTKPDGSTRSGRAIDDFFAYLAGGKEVLVKRGGKGQVSGPGETLTLEAGERIDDAAGGTTFRERTVEFEAPRRSRGKSRVDERPLEQKKIEEVYEQSRKVRKTQIERMAYIAAQLGLDENPEVLRILDAAVSADDRLRVLKLRGRADEEVAEIIEQEKSIARSLRKEFDEYVQSFFLGSVTRGERSPDIFKTISRSESHLGKIVDSLDRKIAGLQELVFSPEAGLANVDSMRFGLDDLDTGKLSLYRVRYLQGLAEDYKIAVKAHEAAKKAAEKAGAGSKATAKQKQDFEAFRSLFADGNESKFGAVVRWIDSSLDAIRTGDPIPPRPAGIVIPERLAKSVSRLRRLGERITDMTQGLGFMQAKTEEEFYEFLRVLSGLNVDKSFFSSVVQNQYRYDVLTEQSLRRQMAIYAGGAGADAKGRLPQMNVYRMEEIPFDEKLMQLFAKGDSSLADIGVIVRTENGYDEIVDHPRSVVDYVRALKKQKFTYKTEQFVDEQGRRKIAYTDMSGPNGKRYVYFVDDEAGVGVGSAAGAAFQRGVGFDPEFAGAELLGVRGTTVGQRILDEPIYALYGRQGAIPDGDPNIYRHYAALTAGQRVSVVKHTDMTTAGHPRALMVGGTAESRTGSVLEPTKFHHMIDPSKTYVFYDIPSKGHRIAERLDGVGLPPQQTAALNPESLFFGITDEVLSPTFARTQEAGTRRTTTLTNKLSALYKRRKELQESIDKAQFDMRARQAFLVELDEVVTEIGSLTKVLNDGLPKQQLASRAAAYELWQRFRQPEVVGFILNRTFDSPDEAASMALDAFKRYVDMLHDFKVKRVLETGEEIEINPFRQGDGVAEARRARLRENWVDSPHSAVISEYNSLNTQINAVAKELSVFKNGGEAADAAARLVGIMEQLRVAQKNLLSVENSVAREFYRSPEGNSRLSLRSAREAAETAVEEADAAVRRAQANVRRASQTAPVTRPLQEAQTRLSRARARGASALEIQTLEAAERTLRAEFDQASQRQAQLSFSAEEELRLVIEVAKTKRDALNEARLAERNAAAAESGAARDAVERMRRENVDPEKFDEFVKKEIEAIKKGRITPISVSVSTERIDDVIAEGAAITQRQEMLASLHPQLQTRYESARLLVDESEKNLKKLTDELDEATQVVRKIEKTESNSGKLVFGGKNLPPEYVAAKMRQKEALKKVSVAQKRVEELNEQMVKLTAEINTVRAAGAETNTLRISKEQAENRLLLVRQALDALQREPRGKPTWVTSVLAKDWQAEFDDISAEVDSVFKALSLIPTDNIGASGKKAVDRTWAAWTKVIEARAAILLSKEEWEAAVRFERSGADQLFGAALVTNNVTYAKVLDDGFIELEGSGSRLTFNNLQMRPEIAEMLGNMGRIRDKQFARSMQRWLGPYTRFFKAWALATPGFHVRNSLTNGFMMIAAGGNPVYLAEAMREYNLLHNFMKRGKTIDEYLETIPDVARRKLISDSYKGMVGSGVGQAEELIFDGSGKLTNNPITRLSKRAGIWIESHSRFMLSYDGIRQGMDVSASTARVRKFLFDYEDTSKLDSVMRQIIPFWTWTSRNFPLTIQNIYMRPRPYQIYESFKRNFQDRERTEDLPLYMREAGAFALPGTDIAATPELGFNRLQADISMLSDPSRLAANVNPMLRVPVEVGLANKSFFRNREFDKTPVQTSGPVGTLASLLGTPIGMGQSAGGQRFVDERLLYALSNMTPILNQAERFIPSQEYYKERGSGNPWLAYLGAPGREVTPQMLTSEQTRRINELRKLLESQPKVREP